MDPPHTSPPLVARGGTSPSFAETLPADPGADRRPRTAELPPIWAHLARPETPEEYFDGELRLKMPSKPPHARQHFQLAYVLRAHVAEGYLGAVELLTRTDHNSDFAPDASVYPAAPDPESGERQLEELAFEVCSEQDLGVPTTKARKLIGRGVRRVFCIVVKGTGKGRRRSRQHTHLLEWSPHLDGWSPVAEDGEIEDRCLEPPMPVRGLLEAAASDVAVARALRARGNPVFEEERAAGFAEGRAEGFVEGRAQGSVEGEARGCARTIVRIIDARGLDVSPEARRRILECRDPAQLERWTDRVPTIATVAELWEETEST